MGKNRIIRYLLNGFGIIDAVMYSVGVHQSFWLLGLGLFAVFLGVTDFGRQCPLFLSARHLWFRIRSGHQPRVQYAKPGEENVKPDRKDSVQ